MNIDRRRVSVETKRLLEQVPRLQFRQGFVIDLRVVSPTSEGDSAKVQAETIFGEVFEADVAVVAAGLSLGGRSSVGGDTVEGGRYGEPASDELLGALKALGAEFREVVLRVGARSAAADLPLLESAARKRAASYGAAATDATSHEETPGAAGDGESGVMEAQLRPVAEGQAEWAWPADYPPAPHRDPTLRLQRMLVAVRNVKGGEGSRTGGYLPVISPDGAATSEVYVARDSFAAEAADDGQDVVTAVTTRMPLTVTAFAATNVSTSGGLTVPAAHGRIWVVGRSAGADDYLESLASGVRGGLDVAAALVGDGDALEGGGDAD
jgi:hypothetical protein